MGVFLFIYEGYEPIDRISGRLACLFIIGTALFPTSPDGFATQSQLAIGRLHFFFAACLFLTLAFISLFLFRKTVPFAKPTKMKLLRNKVYFSCGIIMIICLIFIALIINLPKFSFMNQLNLVFYLESIAVISFGISWFIKGDTLLKDEKELAIR